MVVQCTMTSPTSTSTFCTHTCIYTYASIGCHGFQSHTHFYLVVVLKSDGVEQSHAHPTRQVRHGGAEEGFVPRREVEVIQEEVVKFQREGVEGGGARGDGERGCVKTYHQSWGFCAGGKDKHKRVCVCVCVGGHGGRCSHTCTHTCTHMCMHTHIRTRSESIEKDIDICELKLQGNRHNSPYTVFGRDVGRRRYVGGGGGGGGRSEGG